MPAVPAIMPPMKPSSVLLGLIRGKILRLPKAGETLVTQIDTIEEIFQMTLVNAKVRIGNEIITSCEMKISITDLSTNYTNFHE